MAPLQPPATERWQMYFAITTLTVAPGIGNLWTFKQIRVQVLRVGGKALHS